MSDAKQRVLDNMAKTMEPKAVEVYGTLVDALVQAIYLDGGFEGDTLENATMMVWRLLECGALTMIRDGDDFAFEDTSGEPLH